MGGSESGDRQAIDGRDSGEGPVRTVIGGQEDR